jgi:hypothetical protein
MDVARLASLSQNAECHLQRCEWTIPAIAGRGRESAGPQVISARRNVQFEERISLCPGESGKRKKRKEE